MPEDIPGYSVWERERLILDQLIEHIETANN